MCTQRQICIRVFFAALLVIAKGWNNLNNVTGENIYIAINEYFAVVKKSYRCIYVLTWHSSHDNIAK